jgi:SAM-dependent methyltransferase
MSKTNKILDWFKNTTNQINEQTKPEPELSLDLNEVNEKLTNDSHSYEEDNNQPSDLYSKIRYIEPEVISNNTIDIYDITEQKNPIVSDLLSNPNIDGYNTLQLRMFFHSIYMQEINNKVNDLLVSNIEDKTIKILDVGCGTGELFANICVSYSNEVYRNIKFLYTGIDFNPNMTFLMKSRASNLDIPDNIFYNYENLSLEAYINDVNEESDLYDVIIFSNVFDYDYYKIANKQFITDYFNTVYNYNSMSEYIIDNIYLYYNKLLRHNGSLSVNFINDNEFSRLHGKEALYILDEKTLESITSGITNTYTVKRNYLNILTDVIHLYKI